MSEIEFLDNRTDYGDNYLTRMHITARDGTMYNLYLDRVVNSNNYAITVHEANYRIYGTPLVESQIVSPDIEWLIKHFHHIIENLQD